MNAPTPPVLMPGELRTIAQTLLGMLTTDSATINITHQVTRVTRIAHNRVQRLNNGETLQCSLLTSLGGKGTVSLSINQLDDDTLRSAVQYVERVARETTGDPAVGPQAMPVPPRQYLPNTSWSESTARALGVDRQSMVVEIVQPMVDAQLIGAAFIGASAQSTLNATKQGVLATGEVTDTELVVTGWNRPSGAGIAGSGWAGQAVRTWDRLDAAAVSAEAVRITKLAANPVAFEPGRRTVILGRPAMAQIVHAMGRDFDAYTTHMGMTPLSIHKLRDRVLDERLTLSSDPNDPEGGYLPFDDQGHPRIPMTWIDHGRLANLAYGAMYAASAGVRSANQWSDSLRLSATSGTALMTTEEMIASCKEGIYVNRVADIEVVHARSGVMTGVTSGGCFLVRNGKIDKPVKDFRFLDSPYFFLNRLIAVGTSERTAFGYAPWHGEWPIAPTIVPPVMVRDFNFSALADNV